MTARSGSSDLGNQFAFPYRVVLDDFGYAVDSDEEGELSDALPSSRIRRRREATSDLLVCPRIDKDVHDVEHLLKDLLPEPRL